MLCPREKLRKKILAIVNEPGGSSEVYSQTHSMTDKLKRIKEVLHPEKKDTAPNTPSRLCTRHGDTLFPAVERGVTVGSSNHDEPGDGKAAKFDVVYTCNKCDGDESGNKHGKDQDQR